MIEPFLKSQLEPVARRQRRLRLSRELAVGWLVAAALVGVLVFLRWIFAWHLPFTIPLFVLAAVGWALVAAVRVHHWHPDYRNIARRIEQQHPKLHALLLTAVEQQPDPATGKLNYLQERVIREAVIESQRESWLETISTQRLLLAQGGQLVALAVLVFALFHLRVTTPALGEVSAAAGVTVSPGDAEVERGNAVAVLARFQGRLPTDVTLIVRADGKPEQRIPLSKSLADPVFGTSISEVTTDLIYTVEYGGKRTRDFRIHVFEFPKLEYADARLVYPAYTKLPEKKIPDTRRVSAVEGTQLDLALQLNKPVKAARLIAKDKSVTPLNIATNQAAASLANFHIDASDRYDLQLVDADGRTNKVPAQFVVEALKNRAPELKLLAPRGDQRVSPLEEMNFEAELWDDFGVSNYGLTYTVAGSEPKSIALAEPTGPNEKKKFNHLLRLEDLGVHPDQLVSYFIWADDIGPDGLARRTSSDMYFAEVRPFEEIFREDQTPESNQQQSQSGSQPQSETTKLAELQKQIINATWKLEREHGGKKTSEQYLKDAPVVEKSQEQALEQLGELKERARGAQQKEYIDAAEKEMKKAVKHLSDAAKTPKPLPDALTAEQAAYQALLKLQAREYSVSQNRSRGGGGGGAGANQRQIDQLDLKMSGDRYETQRQASPQKKTEQQEQAQVLNRLKELSQRQQDLNERLKELQTALQEAKSDQEREEIRRRLKRLREEEQQMLADVDELRQRMEQPQNQQRMADARQQLDQIRSDVQNTSQAMQNESVSQALASGTRAERDLQQMREDFRKQNSSQFTEEMRQMRNDARELAQKEEDIAQQMTSTPAQNQRKRLSDAGENKDLADKLDQQKQKMKELLDEVKQVTERAESSEPLLSKQLYDTFRKASQGSADNALATASEMLKRSFPSEAAQAEQRARQEIQELKTGVERAAESVLGDDTEALRQAKKELEDLSRQIEREMAAGGNGTNELANAQTGSAGARAGNASEANSPNENNRQPGAGQSSAQNARENQPDQNGRGENQPSQAQVQNGQGQQPGQANSPANSEGQPGGQRGSAQQPAAQNSGQRGNQASNPNQRGSQQQPGQGAGAGQQGEQAANSGQRGGRNPNGQPRVGASFVDRGGGTEGGDGFTTGGPITGNQYTQWSDRLRDVEEMIDQSDLRNRVATVRERAGVMRQEFRREFKKPDFAQLSLQIVKPLAEVRNRIAEELARRESREALVPIDRDPVPAKYSELVRRYYEKLGSGDDSGAANPKPPGSERRTSFE